MLYARKPKYAFPGPADIVRQTLPNGITMLVRENFASPAVVVNGYLTVGSADETSAQAGLAAFTADVMERGTRKRSFAQLYEEVESIGASFGLSAGVHSTSFGAKGLAESLPVLLDILSDTLLQPAFLPEQVEKVRAEIFTDFQERANDTRRMASLLFHQLTYPETHPYHRSSSGYPETIAPLTGDDLANFHTQYFSPQGMVITVVGAVKAAAVIQAVTDAFGHWWNKRPARAALPPVPALTIINEQRIAIPDKTQSDMLLGWPGPARLDPDFIPCYVTNTVLGVFGMFGRLGKAVREDNGLAYYAYSGLTGGTGPGPWYASVGVNPANQAKALELVLAELHRIRAERVPEAELNDSKSYLTGKLPLQLETNEGVAQSLLNIERFQLGLDYLQRYREMIMEISATQVQAMAQKWLDPDHYALAIAEPEAAPQP